MNLKILSGGEMAALTGPWLDPKQYRALFHSIPAIAWLLPELERAHEVILQSCNAAEAEARIALITEELDRLDVRHDRLIRVLWQRCTLQVDYLLSLSQPRTIEARVIEAARDALLPERMAYAAKSYLEESGNAVQLQARLTPELESVLRGLVIEPGVSALDITHELIAVGHEMSDGLRRRSALADQRDGQSSYYEQRAAWAEVVRSVLENLDRSRAPQEAKETLRRPVIEALEKAMQRQKERLEREKAAEKAAAEKAAAEKGAP